MPKENYQRRLSRVRPPRVQIAYDVKVGEDACEKRDLPFTVGVMADLSGASDNPKEPIAKRKFVAVDRDNINHVMKAVEPRLAFQVPNLLAEDGSLLKIDLRFENMEDFEPARIARQIAPLRALLDLRNNLAMLRSSLIGNDRLDDLLQEVMHDGELLAQAKSEATDAEEKRNVRGE